MIHWSLTAIFSHGKIQKPLDFHYNASEKWPTLIWKIVEQYVSINIYIYITIRPISINNKWVKEPYKRLKF